MSRKGPVRNLAASVHARLLAKAKETQRPFNELFQLYAMERLLYRLSKSSHSRKFVLKGALMFAAWNVPVSRPTKDIDLLGRLNNSIESVAAVVRDICGQPVEPDGLVFDPGSVTAENIVEEAEYGGVRVHVGGRFLGNMKISVQLDIGFGDVIVPAELSVAYPTILDFPAPLLKGYSMESAIAEKFDAMAHRGMANSRMKDFFDIWFLSQRFAFDGAILAEAIRRTAQNRGRAISTDVAAFSPGYVTAKDAQWRLFLRRSRLTDAPTRFGEVMAILRPFLRPVVDAARTDAHFVARWPAGGPWQPQK